jgi:hypothetical protein
VWFWFCVLGYPLLAWAFLLCCWLGYAYARRSGAMAANRVSDDAEQQCHAAASRPLAILGHAWCFSSDDEENALTGLIDGDIRMGPRPSRAEPNTDVNARWIEIPDLSFHAGNELTERTRHDAVCEWLLRRLIDSLAPRLAALPARTPLHVAAVPPIGPQICGGARTFEGDPRCEIANPVPATWRQRTPLRVV